MDNLKLTKSGWIVMVVSMIAFVVLVHTTFGWLGITLAAVFGIPLLWVPVSRFLDFILPVD